jgi:ankyrin repeat protein
LRRTAKKKYETTIRLLLKKRTDVNAHNEYKGTALQTAAGSGHEMTVRLLLKRETDVNAQNENR